MKMIYVEQLPIPPATDAQKAPIIERVQKILAVKTSPLPSPPPPREGEESAPPSSGGRPGGGNDIPQLEAEIDRLVYALYGLTEEEIAVVEGKNP